MNGASRPLIFLKLGGSLITHKGENFTLRTDLLDQVCRVIAQFSLEKPDTRLVLGHGSGSFGHIPAKEFGTRDGVHTQAEWLGFAEVWYRASALNRKVIETLHQHGLAAVSFPPSAAVTARKGEVAAWDLTPLRATIQAGLVPVVYGDVVIDHQLGGTILSTEDLFVHLARAFHPGRILIAGLEPGVWADYPACTRLLDVITPEDRENLSKYLHGAEVTDVTGGMAGKVAQMLTLVEEIPDLVVQIFTGMEPVRLQEALEGASVGTSIKSSQRQIPR